MVNLFNIYELDTWSKDFSTKFSLGDYLLGAVKLNKNANPDKNLYGGYGIGFDGRSQFSLSIGAWGATLFF